MARRQGASGQQPNSAGRIRWRRNLATSQTLGGGEGEGTPGGIWFDLKLSTYIEREGVAHRDSEGVEDG